MDKSFIETYTTAEKKAESPDIEKAKTLISSDAYAVGDALDKLRKAVYAAREALI